MDKLVHGQPPRHPPAGASDHGAKNLHSHPVVQAEIIPRLHLRDLQRLLVAVRRQRVVSTRKRTRMLR